MESNENKTKPTKPPLTPAELAVLDDCQKNGFARGIMGGVSLLGIAFACEYTFLLFFLCRFFFWDAIS